MLYHIYFFIFMGFVADAQDNRITSKASSSLGRKPASTNEITFAKMNKNLERLKVLEAANFMDEIDGIRSDSGVFFDMLWKVCRGELSGIVLGMAPAADSAEGGKTLRTKKEKENCFIELKNLHKQYAEDLFGARERYVEYTHKLRMTELRLTKDNYLKAIDNNSVYTK